MANCITYKPSPRDTLHHSEKNMVKGQKGTSPGRCKNGEAGQATLLES